MTLFPFFEDIENKSFLIVGGGKVAKEKKDKLSLFTDKITVVAENTELTGVHVIKRKFKESDIDAADVVICASDDNELNSHIAALCRKKNIPVNVADNPSLCTFIFPALIKQGDLTVGIATAGKSPVYSAYIKKEFEKVIPDNTEKIIDELWLLKNQLKYTVPKQSERAKILKKKLSELFL
ncbi:MAG: bifunctional precorrin-2 dehydrogenase/sirohydrochlorin ferrochelatase [Clostridiales bacterium]|nr:bifunctional precorrin-2 dehydrogenase/sirohydrochlorin ferrochelatase [Clostridiales bacterium]